MMAILEFLENICYSIKSENNFCCKLLTQIEFLFFPNSIGDTSNGIYYDVKVVLIG